MLERNRCQLRETTPLMTAAHVSSPNDNSSDDNIAASEGNEMKKRRKERTRMATEKDKPPGEMWSPELVRSPAES